MNRLPHFMTKSSPNAGKRLVKPCPMHGCAGFSMVEIMVGMLIGIIAAVVMLQVFGLAEGQKRTASGGGDAQTSGAIALYLLQRDIRQSAFGINVYPLLGCDLRLNPGVNPAVILSNLAPVALNHPAIPAGDANTDTLLVLYGSSNAGTDGSPIVAVAGDQYTVTAPTEAFRVNDRVIAAPQRMVPTAPTTCANLQALSLTQVTASAILSMGMPARSRVTVSAGTAAAGMWRLYNQGPTPVIRAYAVRNGNLTACDYLANDCGLAANTGDPNIWVPIANGIVGFLAQYGRDSNTPVDGLVDTYDQTVAVPPAVPSTSCGWARITALRLALVAKSGQYEKSIVTSDQAAEISAGAASAPNWSGAANTPINLTGLANWKHYRYKVFETVIPLRNIIWMGALTGC